MRTRILAVDDDPAILGILQLMLDHLNCDVLALSDSRRAAEEVNHQEFDGVFLDAQMPHIGGLELAMLIRDSAKNSAVPIVMLTGSQHVSDREPNEAVNLFLEKPFDMESLKLALGDIAGHAGRLRGEAIRARHRTPG